MGNRSESRGNQLQDFRTTDLWDEFGEDLQSVDLPLKDFGGRQKFAGPIRTVQCRKDNVVLRTLLREPGQGAVLVVDGGGYTDTALMGDMVATLAVENGWAGVIINGSVRDSAELATLPVGIRALATNPRSSGKKGEGQVDVEVEFGSVVFRPGDHLYADEDGIVVQTKEEGR